MRALGLNSVTMYVAWNWHETEEGQIQRLDNVTGFLDAAKSTGMLVILRPGPCASKPSLPRYQLRCRLGAPLG